MYNSIEDFAYKRSVFVHPLIKAIIIHGYNITCMHALNLPKLHSHMT